MIHDRSHRIKIPAILLHGRTRELLVEMPTVRFEGVVTVELIHARTGLVKRRLEFKNLITDAGLNYLGSSGLSGALNFIAVGTSGVAPANSQTALGGEVSPRTSNTNGIADVTGNSGSGTYYFRRITRVFTETQANGVLAEFGVFDLNAGGTMFARQLFKDAGGTPTTITKTSADQLQITYELRAYPPTVDATGTTAITGVGNVDWVTRAANVGASGSPWDRFLSGTAGEAFGNWANCGAIAGDSQTLSATSAGTVTTNTVHVSKTTATLAPYVANSFARDCEYAWDPSAGTFDCGSITHTCMWTGAIAEGSASFQTSIAINPGGGKIHKTNLQRLKLTFRYPWGRGP